MESLPSPPPCPHTVTVRRNPVRRARATPSSAIPLREPLNLPVIPLDVPPENPTSSSATPAENLKVYLRIRPMNIQKNVKKTTETKNAWPRSQQSKINSKTKAMKAGEVCVHINEDLRSVTVSTPKDLQDTKRIKSEIYQGFSRVFSSEASQKDVFEEMVRPLVDDFLKGKSGMLAAMGPSGSGKTHTVFGCSRNPGMVPLALNRIFSKEESNEALLSRVLYLSMFEICTEKGKGERMVDLLHNGGDICLQNSVLKGLQEVAITDAHQAESLIERGMMKRATAMTNLNSQSSRSQCIINIRHCPNKGGEEVDYEGSGAVLTIVDLAGAEREKSTGNQSTRLLESNFINNTSMVFGLCLRSLLEHQKNRNKPLQKHYQSSLLTRYLRDYLEGKKRMMLILTVKPGGEDYNHTSFLLRQASPFTKIKFENLEERVQLTPNKRPNKAFPRLEQPKKMKFSNDESLKNSDGNPDGDSQCPRHKEIAVEVLKDVPKPDAGDFVDENLTEVRILSDGSNLKDGRNEEKTAFDREYQIIKDFAKALWTVLKQYKNELEVVKIDNSHLRESLSNVQTKSIDFEHELMSEKARFCAMEKELEDLKSRCVCSMRAPAALSPCLSENTISNISQVQVPEQEEVNSVASSYSSKKLEQLESKTKPFSSGIIDQKFENYPEISPRTQGANRSIDATVTDLYFNSQELLVSTDDTQNINCLEEVGTLDIISSSEANYELTSNWASESGQKSEQDEVNTVRDDNNLEPGGKHLKHQCCINTSLECAHADVSRDCEDPKGFSREESTAEDKPDLEAEKDHVLHQPCLDTSLECASYNASQECEELGDFLREANIMGDEKDLKLEREHGLHPCLDTSVECEGSTSGDLEVSRTESTLLQSSATVKAISSCSDLDTLGTAALTSHEVSPEDQTFSHTGDEELDNEQVKLEPEVTVPLKEIGNIKSLPELHLQPGPPLQCISPQLEKPKRRLRPASSLLLKDISLFDIKDETERPKGAKGGKKMPADNKSRAPQGSSSLINLLTSTRFVR